MLLSKPVQRPVCAFASIRIQGCSEQSLALTPEVLRPRAPDAGNLLANPKSKPRICP